MYNNYKNKIIKDLINLYDFLIGIKFVKCDNGDYFLTLIIDKSVNLHVISFDSIKDNIEINGIDVQNIYFDMLDIIVNEMNLILKIETPKLAVCSG